jgi:hypothetical protein
MQAQIRTHSLPFISTLVSISGESSQAAMDSSYSFSSPSEPVAKRDCSRAAATAAARMLELLCEKVCEFVYVSMCVYASVFVRIYVCVVCVCMCVYVCVCGVRMCGLYMCMFDACMCIYVCVCTLVCLCVCKHRPLSSDLIKL